MTIESYKLGRRECLGTRMCPFFLVFRELYGRRYFLPYLCLLFSSCLPPYKWSLYGPNLFPAWYGSRPSIESILNSYCNLHVQPGIGWRSFFTMTIIAIGRGSFWTEMIVMGLIFSFEAFHLECLNFEG